MDCRAFTSKWFWFQFLIIVAFIVVLSAVVPGIMEAIEADQESPPTKWYKLEYNVMQNQLNIIEQYADWTEADFHYWSMPTHSGVSYFESVNDTEYTQMVEQLLGIDFNNPDSFNADTFKDTAEQRAQEIQDALAEHQKEYNYYPEEPEKVYRNDQGGWEDANGNPVDSPDGEKLKYDDEITGPKGSTRAATGLLMAGTIIPATGLFYGSCGQKYAGNDTNKWRIALLFLIICAAIGFGIHGLSAGNFGERNDVFLNVTKIALFVLFGTTLGVAVLGAFFTFTSYEHDGPEELVKRNNTKEHKKVYEKLEKAKEKKEKLEDRKKRKVQYNKSSLDDLAEDIKKWEDRITVLEEATPGLKSAPYKLENRPRPQKRKRGGSKKSKRRGGSKKSKRGGSKKRRNGSCKRGPGHEKPRKRGTGPKKVKSRNNRIETMEFSSSHVSLPSIDSDRFPKDIMRISDSDSSSR